VNSTWEVLAESGGVIGTVQADDIKSARASMRRMFYTGVAVRLAAEQEQEQESHNYAVFEWSKPSKKWLLRGRFPTPQAAADVAGRTMIVIDVISDTQIWWRGDWCTRQKPAAVPTL
jgi:hypothetical protein